MVSRGVSTYNGYHVRWYDTRTKVKEDKREEARCTANERTEVSMVSKSARTLSRTYEG
jgi:hypothetical protein